MVAIVPGCPPEQVSAVHPRCEVGVPGRGDGHSAVKGLRICMVIPVQDAARDPIHLSPHRRNTVHASADDTTKPVELVIGAGERSEDAAKAFRRSGREAGEAAHNHNDHSCDALTQEHTEQQLSVGPAGSDTRGIQLIRLGRTKQRSEIGSDPSQVVPDRVRGVVHRTT